MKKPKMKRIASLLMAVLVTVTSLHLSAFAEDIVPTSTIRNLVTFTGQFDSSMIQNIFYQEDFCSDFPADGSTAHRNVDLEFYKYYTLSDEIDPADVEWNDEVEVSYDNMTYCVFINKLDWDHYYDNDFNPFVPEVPAKIWIYKIVRKTVHVDADRVNQITSALPYGEDGITKEELDAFRAEANEILRKAQEGEYASQEEVNKEIDAFEAKLQERLKDYSADYSQLNALYRASTLAGLTEEQNADLKELYDEIPKNLTVVNQYDLNNQIFAFHQRFATYCGYSYGSYYEFYSICDYRPLFKVIDSIDEYTVLTDEQKNELRDYYTNEFNWKLRAEFDDESALVSEYVKTLQGKIDAYAKESVDKVNAELTELLNKYNNLDTSKYQKDAVEELKNFVKSLPESGYTSDNVKEGIAAVAKLKDMIENLPEAPKMADYTKINQYISQCEELTEQNYTTASWARLQAAINAVVYNLPREEQTTVDEMAEAIRTAYESLDMLDADYTDLKKVYDNVPDESFYPNYTTDSLEALKNALSNIDWTLKIDSQDKVNEMTKNLQDALDGLVINGADYTAVYEQKARVSEENADCYTKETWKDVQAALDAIIEGLGKDRQSEVDKMAGNLKNAIDALVELPADYKKIETVKKRIPDDLSLYTDGTVATLNKALNAVEYGLGKTQQAKVNQWAADILRAVKNLQYKDADYSEVDRQLSRIPENLNLFTDKTADAVTAAKEAVVRGYDITKQDEVDQMAEQLKKAIDALEYKDADYSKIEELKETIPSDLSNFTDESVDALNKALNQIDYTKDITAQDEVDKWAADLRTAIDGLTEKPADYSSIDKLIEQLPEDYEKYYSGAEAVKTVLDSVERGLPISKQTQVDAWAKDLREKMNNLRVKDADYSEVDVLIESVKDTSIYTEDSYAAFEEAKNAVVRGLDIFSQDKVDQMAATLREAIGKLQVKPADYTKLDKVIATIPAGYGDYYDGADAVAAILNSVDRTLDITKQDTVDEWAESLTKAIEALTLKKADYSKLEELLKTVPEDLSVYTEATAKAVKDVVDAIDYNCNILEQEKVNKMTEDLRDAINGLKKSGTEYKTEISPLESVDEGLGDRFKTVDDIKAAFESEIKKLTDKKFTSFVYDVKLFANVDEEGWNVLSAPSKAVKVTFAYPEGTNKDSFDFYVLHMVSTGEKAGTIEILKTELTDEGIVVYADSFSPFAVAYAEKDKNDNNTGDNNGNNTGEKPDADNTGNNTGNNANNNSSGNNSGTDSSVKAPATGDFNYTLYLIILIAGVSILGLAFLSLKMRRMADEEIE